MDGEQSIPGVLRALQHGLKLEGFRRGLEFFGFPLELGLK
jgi:hypothetical protein